MKSSKIIIDGEEKEISLGISEEEIENNEDLEDTIDLTEILEKIDGES